MTPSRPVLRALPVLALLLPLMTQAARPLNTDDARIVDHGGCQLESWLRHTSDGDEAWALPGCNVTGNLEVTLGGARVRDDAGSRPLATVLQAKTLFRTLQPHGWGWGLAVGVSRDREAHSTDPYAYVPITWAVGGDATFVHANLGARREAAAHRWQGTWGVGIEHLATERFGLIGEVYAQDRDKPFYQLGGRVWLVKDRVQVDATAGNRFHGGAQRWMSLGLRLLTPPFLN